MAYIPKSDSVVAFQSNPSVLQTLSKITNAITDPIPVQPPASGSLPVINIGSIITTSQGSVAVAIISGSVAVATGNSSVQVLNFPVTQNISGSVATFPQGTIITSLVSTVPSSVIVGASIFGLAPVNVTNTNINVSGSVAAFVQGTPNVNTAGSVVAFQGTDPWIITGSIQGGGAGTEYTEDVAAPADPVGGALVLRRTDTPSVSSSADGDWVIQNATNYGAAYVQVVDSSGNYIDTFGSANQSVSGTIGASVIGTVPVTQSGTQITSIVNIVPSSVIVGASIFGLAPVNITNTNINVSGSVAAHIRSGSVIAVLGGNTSVITVPRGSVMTIPVKTGGSSVYAVLSSITAVSIMTANSARVGGTIYNNAGTPVYIGLGVTPVVTTSIFTTILQPNDYYELPYGWSSVVGGITASTTGGRLTVTEIRN